MKQLNLWPCAFLIALLLFGVPVTAQQKLNSSQTNRVERNAKTTISTEEETLKTTDISPREAFKSKKEVVAKRDAYSKHYQNEDGSYTALIGAGPIHYEKNGQFEDIDHSITRSGNPAFPYANTTNLFESYFGETSHTGVKNKTAEGELIEFLNTKMYWEVNGRPVNERASANVSVTIDGDKAYYNNLYGNISAEFITLTGKRKLNYIIPNRQEISNAPQNAEYLVFTEDVVLPEGWTSKETENGILIKNAAGKEIYLYENPASTDAANALDREKNTVFETVLNGNILTIVTKVKTAWLLSNDRQFPVMVDPTVNVYPNDTTQRTAQMGSTGIGDYGNMAVGYSGGYYRSYASFNTASITDNSDINNVVLHHNVGGGQWMSTGSDGGSRGSEIRAFLDNPESYSGWSNKYNAVTSTSNSPTLYTTVLNLGITGWKPGVTLGSTANTHLKNGLVNDRFTIGYRPAGSYNTASRAEYALIYGWPDPGSQNREPYLTITYTELSTDRTLTVSQAYTGANPANGSHIYANNTSVTATSGTRAGYEVTGWTGTGNVPTTGTSGSSTFTMTQNSSITWQWQQTGTPNDVVFHNYGGTEQLAFNNSRVATTTPTFRLSHSAYSANAYEVQINTSPTFTGTGFTQEFTVANPLNTETNLTFNNGFAPTEGTTYYVRARVKGDADVWSSWSSDTNSFTYDSSQTTPNWYQTTATQFSTDVLNGVSTHASGGVITNPGGNRIVNGSFENGMTGWNVSSSYTSGSNGYQSGASDYWSTDGSYSLEMWNGSPGSTGYFTNDYISRYQSINLTGVSNLLMDAAYEGGGSNIIQLRVYVAETSQPTGTSGILVHSWTPSSNTSTAININLTSYSFTGNKVLKLVYYVTGQETTTTMRYLNVDNVRAFYLPAGTVTSTPIQLASALGAEGYDALTWNQTLNGGSLSLRVQGSADGSTFTDIPGYTNISEAGDGIKSFDLSGMETPPAHIRVIGTLDGEGVHLHNWSVSFVGAPEPVYDFVYLNDTEQWEPNYPGDTANPSNENHSILIMEGTAVFNGDIVAGTLTVNEDAHLKVVKILKLHGNLINNGHITFKSSGIEETAQFDTFEGQIMGEGLVTTERFLPGRRAYRFLSPAVTTTTSIHANWQENGVDTAGLGTHITGTGGAANGFDPTGTNNPSMFTVATNGDQQFWEAVSNTNSNTLVAGSPYLLMVRGDRTIDLTSNNPEPSNTVLRSTGALATGDQTFTGPELLDGQEFFIGNPYQAGVSVYDLLNESSNLNPHHYYLYNPALAGENGRGQFVVVDMDFGGISTPPSAANGFLQPGQSFLVKASGGVPSVTFKESHKIVDELTSTFRSTDTRIAVQLFYADAFTNGETPTDGISIKFSENGNNGIDAFDAPKMTNFDENFAVLNNDKLLSIESRTYPENEEIIPLSIDSYRKTHYVLEGKVVNLPALTTIYLYDNYTNIFTEISDEGSVSYSFEVEPSIPESVGSDRFELRFNVNLLGIEDYTMSAVALFPNPLQGDSFQILANGFESEALDVEVVNMLGQVVYSGAVSVASNGVASVNLSTSIASGIYNVKIVSKNNQTINKKLIKK